jgi:hypothetical protein
MTGPKVQMLAENTGTMTFAQGLAFIARTRRQLDRFDNLPDASQRTIAPESAAKIRRLLDELEADINQSLSTG